MMHDKVKIGFIHALKENYIEPYRINLMHYFSYENQTECIEECLRIGVKYMRDKYRNTPLEYAIKRNSNQCVGVLLNHAIYNEKIIDTLNKEDICDLIVFSPANIDEFFINTVHQYDLGINKFAKLKQNPSIFMQTENIKKKGDGYLEKYISRK